MTNQNGPLGLRKQDPAGPGLKDRQCVLKAVVLNLQGLNLQGSAGPPQGPSPSIAWVYLLWGPLLEAGGRLVTKDWFWP